ncbi:restriction endonuclease subunit S [Hyphococcus lacteus]|uniref:Restriction endonuclease subunit S n=1 Tax=Hyphococcus lacteus TaxID=3143536 RepID=A0ABV3Z3B7_9PROT
MAKSANEKSVPKLRFPEFEDCWNVRRLDSTGKFKSGSGFPEIEQGGKEGVPFLKVSDMNLIGNETEITTANNYLTADHIKRLGYRPIYSRAIIFAKVGAAIFLERKRKAENFLIDNNMMAFVPSDLIDYDYLACLFGTIIFSKFAQIGALPSYNAGDLGSIKVALPTISEQKKIAAFLGAVDDRLAALRKKRDLLSDYKRGAMQQIFSQKIRFTRDDGTPYPGWEEKKLGEVSAIYDGTHQTPKYVKSGVPFYSVEHVTANDFSKTKYIAEEVYASECNRVSLERNDILMTRIGDIGTARIIDWDVRASFYVSLALIKCTSDVIPSFLLQCIRSSEFQQELHKRTIHVAFPRKINLGEIGHCLLGLPHREEQQKIADFLSAIDAKIDAVAQQIDRTETFKKGLLQQMFI